MYKYIGVNISTVDWSVPIIKIWSRRRLPADDVLISATLSLWAAAARQQEATKFLLSLFQALWGMKRQVKQTGSLPLHAPMANKETPAGLKMLFFCWRWHAFISLPLFSKRKHMNNITHLNLNKQKIFVVVITDQTFDFIVKHGDPTIFEVGWKFWEEIDAKYIQQLIFAYCIRWFGNRRKAWTNMHKCREV